MDEKPQQPVLRDFQTQLRVMRESILALYWGIHELEEHIKRVKFRNEVQAVILGTLQNLDLFLTGSIEARIEGDFGRIHDFCYGVSGGVRFPLSDNESYLVIRWPVNEVSEVVDCEIPRKAWRTLTNWNRLNVSKTQPREFEYPNGKQTT